MGSQVYRPGALACSVLLAVVYASPLHADTNFVRRGDNLQTALNSARAGDVLLLEAGAEFVGNFVLPVKSGDSPIVVRSAPSALLPADGVRIKPEHQPLLARVRSSNTAAALRTAAGAHHWELRYLEFGANQNGYGDIIQLGDGSSAQNTLGEVPHHLVLGHLYVHGDPRFGQKRCIALNAASVTIRDSHVSDCKGVGVDTQAIGGWNGPGPYLIENNYLEATGENVIFGGADPAIPNLVPDGITFRRNHVARPLAWRNPILRAPSWAAATGQAGGTLPAGIYAYRIVARRPVGQGTIGRSTASIEATAAVASDGGAVRVEWEDVPDATEYRVYGRTAGAQAGYWTVTSTSFVDTGAAATAGAVPTSAGTVWSVKNLFELKNARNVVIEDNIFENHWKESQPGYAIVFTPRNSNGACTWCIVEQVRFENNIVRHVAAGINLLGYDIASRPTRQTADVVVRNNLLHDMGAGYGGGGWFLLMGDEPRNVLVDHNTVSHTGNALAFIYGGTAGSPRRIYGARITNNAAKHGSYGINGEFFSYGNGIIQGFLPGAVVTGNYLAGGSASRYPAGNRTAGTFEAQFVDPPQGDFRLAADSQLRGAATDGGDIGADMGNLLARVANVETGLPTTPPVSAPVNLRVVRR
jgi:hypothetical protein